MKIGMLLLSQDGYYIDVMGAMPPGRPSWDKEFLMDVCQGLRVLCSDNTIVDLPASLFTCAKSVTTDSAADYDVNLGITTLGTEDLLFITRCNQGIMAGKQFRLDNYERILKQGDFEIWKTVKKKP